MLIMQNEGKYLLQRQTLYTLSTGLSKYTNCYVQNRINSNDKEKI